MIARTHNSETRVQAGVILAAGKAKTERLPRRVTTAEIQQRVARIFEIPLYEMQSQRRSAVVARPRQVAMYLSKRFTLRSLPEIGRSFGDRDHTTVIHGIRRISDLRKNDPDLDEQIAWVEAELIAW